MDNGDGSIEAFLDAINEYIQSGIRITNKSFDMRTDAEGRSPALCFWFICVREASQIRTPHSGRTVIYHPSKPYRFTRK